MTATGDISAGGASSRWRRLSANAAATLATLMRKPRPPGGRWPAATSPLRLTIAAIVAAAAIVVTMKFFDQNIALASRRLPPGVLDVFEFITEFGRSAWFLVPIGILLLAATYAALREVPRFVRLVLASVFVRLGFLFLAIGAPGLFVTIVKRLIGRARPFLGEEDGPLVFMPFVWKPEYAGFPSGHGTNGFAAAVAIGAIWPRLRPLMWTYAALIAASRVVITAHYASDVLASAFVGMVGALLVRDWFAVRRLGFTVDPAGKVRALPGPSWRRIKAVARRLLAQ